MVEEFKKEKMERLAMNAREAETGKECSKDSSEPDNGVTESKACPDLHKDLTDLTSQVQMMSDSLAACKQMPRYRPLRKVYDVAAGATPQTSRPALPPAGKAAPSSAWGGKDAIVSYATTRTNSVKQLRRWNGRLSQESVSDGDLRCWADCAPHAPSLDPPHPPGPPGEADTDRVADLIQRELRTLGHLAPSAALLATLLSDTLLRYTGCRRCSKRISSSLPWILNRIRELIVYVATKRKGTCSYGFRPPEPTVREAKKSAEEERADSGPPSLPEGPEIAKSAKVDASAASGARPGVQILLRVKPERQKKRFFQSVDLQPPQTQANRCCVQLREAASVPVVHVVKPRPQPQLLGETKREVSAVKEYAFGACLLFKYHTRTPASVLELTPVATAVAVRRARETLDLRAVAPFEERTLQWKRNSLTVLTKKTLQAAPTACRQDKNVLSEATSRASLRGSPRAAPQEETAPPGETHGHRNPAPAQGKPPPHGSNERRSYGLSDFLANAPDLVKELLKEAEEEKMEMKKLEVDVNGLKDLMLEIHRNQIELSRFLLENGIYSQPIIKLTNPHMLEEESAALRKLEDSLAGNGCHSVESLQGEIRELKERCTMKKKMVVSLVKGLQSDVPHEWWEEMMNSSLRPSEEIDYERFSELYGNISFFLMNNEQASRKTTRAVEQPSEEEPITKGKVGADIKEDLINLSFDGGNAAKAKAEGLQDWQHLQRRIWAFPAFRFPKEVNTSILKLENQISLLNLENEKLWDEIHELKDQLAGSVKELSEKKQCPATFSQRPPVTGKTINLTIQIATEKMPRPSLNTGFPDKSETESAGSQESFPGTAESSAVVNVADLDARSGKKQLQHEDSRLTLLATKPKFHLKPSRGRSQDDLSSVDDASPAASKGESAGRSGAFAQGVGRRVQQVMVATPHPSAHGFLPLRRPAEVLAGPSGIFHQPSLARLAEAQSPEAHAAAANERQLLPILENDRAGPSTSAEAAGQAIQRLRTRVRSIHKEVAVLKLKNVRIEKLLDRLMDDAVYNNNRSLEEMQDNLRDFTARLG